MSLKIDLNTSDYDVKIRVVRNVIQQFTPRLIFNSANLIKDIEKQVVPVDKGVLRDSIEATISENTATISTNSGYGKFVDEDTQAHEIVASIGKVLRFVIDGEEFFRKRVFIPFRRGVQFRRETLNQFQVRFIDVVRQTWEELS